MTTEFKEIKNDLESMTQEQLKEIQQKVQEKIEAWKKDANFSDEELKDLSDLNSDKIDSDSEKELNNYLKNLDNLEKQIDFLLTLVKIKTEKNIWSKTQVEVAENTASNANSIIDMFRNGANKVKDKINKLRNKSNPEEELKEQLKKQLEENKNDSTKIKELKGIWTSFLEKWDLNSAKNIIKIVEKIQENIPNEFKERTKNVYIDQKLKNIEEIIGNLKNKWSVEKSDILSIRLEIYDITYSRDMTWDQEMVNLYSKDVEQVNDLDEAIAMLNYTNRNYAELDGKWVRIWENSLGSVDNQEEILTLQNKLIEKIYGLVNKKNEEEIKNNSWKEYFFSRNIYKTGVWHSWELKIFNEEAIVWDEIKEQQEQQKEQRRIMLEEARKKRIEEQKLIEDESRKKEDKDKQESMKKTQEYIKNTLDKFNWNWENLNFSDFQLFLSFKEKIEDKNMKMIENFSKHHPLSLNQVNVNIINQLLSNKNIKINPYSLWQLNVNKEFIEKVDLKLLLEKSYDTDIKVKILRSINSEIWDNENEIKKRLWFIESSPELKEIINWNNRLEFLNISRVFSELEGLADDAINETIERAKKGELEGTEKWITYEWLVDNIKLVSNFIIRNLNTDKQDFANKLFDILINNNFSGIDEEIQSSLLYWPKNIYIAKSIINDQDKINKSKFDLQNITRSFPNKIKNDLDYINFVIDKVNFSDERNKISNFFNLSYNPKNSLYILSKIKTQVLKSDENNSILNYLEEDEVMNLIFLFKKGIHNTNDLKQEEKKVLEEFYWKLEIYQHSWINEIWFIKKNLGEDSKSDEEKSREIYEILKSQGIEIPQGKIKEITDKIRGDSDPYKTSKEIFKIIFWEEAKTNQTDIEKQRDILKKIAKILEKEAEIRKREAKQNLKEQNVNYEDINEFADNEIEKFKQSKEYKNLSEEDKKSALERKRKELYKEYLRKKWKTEKEIQDIIEEMSIIDKSEQNIKKAKIIQNNDDVVIQYIHSWYEWSFESFAIENKIPLKNEKWEIINAKEIWISTNYIYKEWIIISNSSGVRIDTKKGTMKDINGNEIKLSQNEINLIKQNEEVAESIINLYQSLEKVWLSKLWNIRESIFRWIENTLWVQFKRNDWDYLSEREIKIFFNSILTSVWEKSIKKELSLDSFLHKIELINGRQITWNEKQVNAYWDSKIEALFIEKFVPRWDLLWFKQIEFEKEIKTGD